MLLVLLVLAALLPARCAFADPWGILPNFYDIVDNGSNELLLSGYTWHDPLTYDAETRAQLNSFSAGTGYARVLANSNGTTEVLSVQGFDDSHYQLQLMALYTKYWSAKLNNDFSVGLGYTAGLSRRPDAFDGYPEPVLLPVAVMTIANRVDIYLSYVPHLPSFLQLKGDVAIIFAGVRF